LAKRDPATLDARELDLVLNSPTVLPTDPDALERLLRAYALTKDPPAKAMMFNQLEDLLANPYGSGALRAAAYRVLARMKGLELFFDLVFVFTITQLTAVLYHAPALRSLEQVVLMLGVIWWMYGGYAWMTNAVSAHTAIRRLLLLGGMGGYFVLALSIPHAF